MRLRLWATLMVVLTAGLFVDCIFVCIGAMLDGAQIEVTLAKPVDKDTYMKSPKYQRQFNSTVYVPVDQYGTILPFYPSYLSSPK